MGRIRAGRTTTANEGEKGEGRRTLRGVAAVRPAPRGTSPFSPLPSIAPPRSSPTTTLLIASASRTSPSAEPFPTRAPAWPPPRPARSEEHTSELQSHSDLVCRLLL